MTSPNAIARTRIKFCGITRVEDARAAVALGVDAVGLVLTRKSRRFVDPELAREIRRALPPFVTAAALFMDDDPAWIAAAIDIVAPDMLQFHGHEDAADCVRYGRRYLKAVPMGGDADVHRVIAAHPQATGFLLDGHAAGEQGGSGRSFDWSLVPTGLQHALLLAGGLTCDNVGAAIRSARPYAVDVSSGIESVPGVKDAKKMRRFVDEVRRASGEQGAGDKS
ncbi:MAG: phosphoribosylanthranilate isomerase [Rudaea sp.]|nr:phosphoribosylanthranilate isomerase [Rudaea sp.]